MKLLLTSAGITNKSLADALFQLVGKKPEDTSLAYIPTAANIVIGDKGWLIDDLIDLKKLNFKSIEIADISADEEKIWKQKFESADVLFFEGGDTFHLMEWVNKVGLDKEMRELLKTKVYVGASAGSAIVSKDLRLGLTQKIYEENLDRTTDLEGLGLVDFYIISHFNSNYFLNVREDFIRKATEDVKEKIYVIDDNSAIVVTDTVVDIVSEGKWFRIN